MNRKDAERVIEQMTRPVFAFALKRCKTTEDAEDLSQEILLRAYRSLITRDDVEDPEKFTWTVAHNALANYYRDYRGGYVGVMIDGFAETLGVWDEYFKEDDGAAIDRMRREIAYLSKLQRRIVIAYYYEGKKQQEIANELGIPLGTVKWHLFDAKRELKKGMEKMRDTSELKFNPIKFDTVGLNGHAGTGAKNTKDYFRTTLTQNICYCVRNSAKTVEEIADALGVSPVYVEGEVEYLEEMCFLKKQNGKYIVNFLIDEPTSEYLTLQNDMYRKTASLFANDLYDELVSGGLLDDPGIICNQTDGAVDLKTPCRTDRNFVLWSLIPFIAGMSGEDLMDETVKSEEVMTIRPDGGCNIVHATVIPDDLSLPDDYVYMKNWCGPMWSEINGIAHWQINSEWSERKALDFSLFPEETKRIISLYREEKDGPLSRDDYAWLAERGYVKTCGDVDGDFKSLWQIVILENPEIKKKLIAVGDRLKEKYKDEFDALKAPYIEATLNGLPEHLRKMRQFELQFVFASDGWFLLHCIKALLDNGKLKPPTEEQKKILTTILFSK